MDIVSKCGYNVCTDVTFMYCECLYHYKADLTLTESLILAF